MPSCCKNLVSEVKSLQVFEQVTETQGWADLSFIISELMKGGCCSGTGQNKPLLETRSISQIKSSLGEPGLFLIPS